MIIITVSTTNYPQTITQATGGHYSVFHELNNLKKKDGYIRSKDPVQGKNKTKYRPSYLVCTNYKFNIPQNSRIKKIIVEYKHYKRLACVSRQGAVPCDPLPGVKMGNIGAPKIRIGNSVLNSNASTAVGEWEQKGKAPTTSHDNVNSVVFTFNNNIPANYVNNGFRVVFEYPANSNTYECYIYIKYIRVRIEYEGVKYDLALSKVSGGYNKEDLTLQATCTNVNLLKGSPVTVLTAPRGLSYKSFSGNGRVTVHDARTIEWRPNIGERVGNVNANFVFEPQVTFEPGQTSYNAEFVLATSSYNSTSKTCNVSITNRPAQQDMDTDDSDSASFDDDTSKDITPINRITVNEEVDFTLTIDEVTWHNMAVQLYGESGIQDQVTFEEFLESYLPFMDLFVEGEFYSNKLSVNELLEGLEYRNWTTDIIRVPLYRLSENDNSLNLKLRGLNEGYDEIHAYVRWGSNDPILISTWKFDIAPAEEDLSLPMVSLMTLSDEEKNRLGEGYAYTVQSDMKLTTTEEYVRNWYKNFRMGVFNNPIRVNQSTYIKYQTSETSQDREIVLPSRFTEADNILIETFQDLNLTYDEVVYELRGNDTLELSLPEDYELPVLLEMVSDDIVNLRVYLRDVNDNVLYEMPYQLIFDDYEDLPPEEVIVDPTDYDSLTLEDIFNNAEYWSDSQAGLNEFNNVVCDFTYDENYPLYILVVGDYIEGHPNDGTLIFDEPCIIEATEFTSRQSNGIFPLSILDLIDGSNVELLLNTDNTSNNIVLYDFPLSDDYGTNDNIAIRGIELIGNIEQTDYQVFYATLRSPTGKTGTRSIILDDAGKLNNTDYDLSVGGHGDLWGFTTIEMVDLADWSMQIAVANTLGETDANINFGDLQIVLYVEQITNQELIVRVEDENLAYYGADMQTVTVPEGLKTDTDFLTIEGSDKNDPCRQNIRPKTVELEFDVGGDCETLPESTESLRQITRLLTNERDELNRPIPKKLEISHYPDVEFYYVMEDPIDADVVITHYECKVKLTIYDGTSFDKNNTVTSTMGYVQGIAKIHPVILVKPSANEIEITEENSRQKFNINLPETSSITWKDGVIEIDCEDQICWWRPSEDDPSPVNINQYVDFNVDWFSLHGEYDFTGVGCTVRTVDYVERW